MGEHVIEGGGDERGSQQMWCVCAYLVRTLVCMIYVHVYVHMSHVHGICIYVYVCIPTLQQSVCWG